MNEKLNVQNLVDALAEQHGLSKKNADSFVKEFFELIEESLKKDKYVKIKGLGTFKLIDIESRESVNVNTGERFEIQGHTKVSFTPEPTLKDVINRPFAHFETVALNEGTVLEGTPVEGEEEEAIPEQEASVPEAVEEAKIVPPVLTARQEAVARAKASAITTEVTAEYTKQESASKIADPTPAFTPAPPAPRDAAAMKYFIGVVVFVILLCGGALLFMYYPDLLDSSNPKAPTEKVAEAVVQKPVSTVVVEDSTQLLPESVVTPQTGTATPPQTVPKDTVQIRKNVEPQKQAKSSELISLGYTIVGTETEHLVKPGETLIKISSKYYGVKNLWPYIVAHNPVAIKNSENVPFGTKIKIPKLVKKQ